MERDGNKYETPKIPCESKQVVKATELVVSKPVVAKTSDLEKDGYKYETSRIPLEPRSVVKALEAVKPITKVSIIP